jgi:hypothetical protein
MLPRSLRALVAACFLISASIAREARAEPPSWAAELTAVRVIGPAGSAREILLYRADGTIDRAQLEAFAQVAAHPEQPVVTLSPRLVQLVVKSARHFRVSRVEIVSAARSGTGRHAHGEAIDFRLSGVDHRKLAAYLRTLPRVGVGVYTHRRTRFVHLDVREQSYHWLDASPPKRRWKEMRLRDPKAAARDSSYTPAMDLPTDAATPAPARTVRKARKTRKTAKR